MFVYTDRKVDGLKIGQKPSCSRDGINTKRRIDEEANAGVAAAAHTAVINDFPAVKKNGITRETLEMGQNESVERKNGH
jgi:hypothetical protein